VSGRKRQFVFLLLFLVCLALGGRHFIWKRYHNRKHRFSILFPRSWQRENDYQGTVVLARSPLRGPEDKFQENINVVAVKLPQKISLEMYFEINEQEIMRIFPGAKFDISQSEIFAGRFRGKQLAFSSKIDETSLRILTATWIRDEWAYAVTCTGRLEEFSRYQPTFKKIMESLRFK